MVGILDRVRNRTNVQYSDERALKAASKLAEPALTHEFLTSMYRHVKSCIAKGELTEADFQLAWRKARASAGGKRRGLNAAQARLMYEKRAYQVSRSSSRCERCIVVPPRK